MRFMAQPGTPHRRASSPGGRSRSSFERCEANANSPLSRTTSAQIASSHDSLSRRSTVLPGTPLLPLQLVGSYGENYMPNLFK